MAQKTEYIHVICSLEFKEEVKKLATEEGLKVGPYIKMLLTNKIKEKEKNVVIKE